MVRFLDNFFKIAPITAKVDLQPDAGDHELSEEPPEEVAPVPMEVEATIPAVESFDEPPSPFGNAHLFSSLNKRPFLSVFLLKSLTLAIFFHRDGTKSTIFILS